MKEVFTLLADYNAKTNQEMFAVLEQVPAAKLAEKNGLFFDSIAGTLNHLLQADVAWIGRFAASFPGLEDIVAKLPDLKGKDPKTAIYPDLASFKKVRLVVDEAMKALAKKFPEDKYGAVLNYKNMKGEAQSKTVWHALLHFFNHGTHHRGQIAAALDQLQVQNDFSNLISKV